MKKRFLNLFLALALVICVLPVVASAAPGCVHNKTAKSTVILVPAKAPTCEEDGYLEHYLCTVCNKAMQAYPSSYQTTTKPVVPAPGHTEVGYKAQAATCSTPGRTYGTKCTVCETVLSGMEEIPATGEHVYDAGTVTKEATCQAFGSKKYVCTNAGCKHSKTERIMKVPHSVQGQSEVAPTCVEDGRADGSWCWVCKTVLNGMETIPATGEHDWQFVRMIHDATCQEKRLNYYECKDCDATKEDTTGGLLNCNIVLVKAVAPTCITTGKTAGTKCLTCGTNPACDYCKEITELPKDIAALGHDQERVKINTEPTCDHAGEGVYDCTRCGYDGVVKAIPKLGHSDVVEILREPTCTRDGWKEITCANEGCGQCTINKIPATGHKEETIPAVAATCTETGLSAGKKCSVCDEILTAQTVTAKAEHVFGTPVAAKAVSCTEDGYTAHTKCNNCDATQGKEEIDTDGHNFVNYVCTVCNVRDGSCEHEGASITVTQATCAVDGLKKFQCNTCGYAYEEVLEAPGHTEETRTSAGTCTTKGKTWKVCTTCGETTVPATETEFGAHTAVDGVCTTCGTAICTHSSTSSVTKKSNCTAKGSITVTCNGCGKVTVTELPLAAHTYVNGICSFCGHKDSNRVTNDYQDVYIVG